MNVETHSKLANFIWGIFNLQVMLREVTQ